MSIELSKTANTVHSVCYGSECVAAILSCRLGLSGISELSVVTDSSSFIGSELRCPDRGASRPTVEQGPPASLAPGPLNARLLVLPALRGLRVNTPWVTSRSRSGPSHSAVRLCGASLCARTVQVQVQVCFTSVGGQVQPLDVALRPDSVLSKLCNSSAN
jgi:hypothetical protein